MLDASTLAQGGMPVPRSAAEWRALRLQRAQAIAPQLEELRARFGVTVTPQMVAGVRCYVAKPQLMADKNRDRLVLSLHGGAHVFRAGEAATLEAIYIAGLTGLKVLAVDYRMPPEHPFPAGMDDVIAVWKNTLQQVKPAHTALFGMSSGGGLALAFVQRAKQENLPLPAALVAATPWSDLSKTGDSYFTHAGDDKILDRYEGLLEEAAKLYAAGRDLKDPSLSPVYGDFSGFPPTFLVAGTRDLFLSNTVRVQRKLKQAGVHTQLEVLEGESHGEFMMPNATGAASLFADIAAFLAAHLAQ